ncbi:hypothetical protein BC833DRAFT_569954, partial [Globomyces pollinis-pini]
MNDEDIPNMNVNNAQKETNYVKRANGNGYYNYDVNQELHNQRNKRQLDLNTERSKKLKQSIGYIKKLEESSRTKEIAKQLEHLRLNGFCLLKVSNSKPLELEISGLLELYHHGRVQAGHSCFDDEHPNVVKKLQGIASVFESDDSEYEYQDLVFNFRPKKRMQLSFKRFDRTTNIKELPSFFVVWAIEKDTRMWVCPKSHSTKKKILLPWDKPKKGQRVCSEPAREVDIPEGYMLIGYTTLLFSESEYQNNLTIGCFITPLEKFKVGEGTCWVPISLVLLILELKDKIAGVSHFAEGYSDHQDALTIDTQHVSNQSLPTGDDELYNSFGNMDRVSATERANSEQIRESQNNLSQMSMLQALSNVPKENRSLCDLCNYDEIDRYWDCSWEHIDGCPKLEKLFRCEHVNPVISKIVYFLGSSLDYSLTTVKKTIVDILANSLSDGPDPFVPGTFYNLNLSLHTVGLYLTTEQHLILVGVKRNKTTAKLNYFCYHCARNGNCRHISKLPPIEESPLNDREYQIPVTSQRPYQDDDKDERLNIISTFKYPYDLNSDTSLIKVINERLKYGSYWWLENKGYLAEPLYENRRCRECLQNTTKYQMATATLFTISGFHENVQFCPNWCEMCQKVLPFDGRSYGILNISNKKFFAVEFILEMLEFKVNGGTPTFTYWKSKVDTYLMMFSKSEFIQKEQTRKELMNMAGKVNRVIVNYLKLVEFPESIFQCCVTPNIVCIDGTVLSIEQRKIKGQELKQPWHGKSVPLNTRFSTRKERNVISISSQFIDAFRDFTRDGISEQRMNTLSSHFKIQTTNEQQQIHPLVSVMKSLKVNDVYRSPPVLVQFFRFFYKSISPAISIAPKAIWPTLDNLLDTEEFQENHIELCSGIAPLMSTFLCHYVMRPVNLLLGLNLLRHILTVAKGTLRSSNSAYQSNIEHFYQTPGCIYQELFKTGSFFPGRPPIRRVTDIRISKGVEMSCNKDAKIPGKLGSGVLLYWCGEHRCCIGFSVLEKSESIQEVYTTLIARFPTLPKVIIYDNGCNLHDYFLNRSPSILKETIILSDGFHWKNHTNCGPTYN